MAMRTTFVVALCVSIVRSSMAADGDPLLMLKGQGIGDVMHFWEIPQSLVASLPRWDPLAGEAPLPPHRAAAAATEFLRDRFGPSVQLTLSSICVGQTAVRPEGSEGPGEQVWDYQILFHCEPEPRPEEQPLLNVMVLMNGSVVVPVARPSK